jgi:hypothetical protein
MQSDPGNIYFENDLSLLQFKLSDKYSDTLVSRKLSILFALSFLERDW